MSKKNLLKEIRAEIKTLVEFYSSIENLDEATFDNENLHRLSKINELSTLAPEHREGLMKWCFELVGEKIESSTIMRHAREKSFGYPGDFQLIDWIYTNKPDSEGEGLLWDSLFLRQPGAQSIRNRKDILTKRILSAYEKHNRISGLNLACGPCREIMEIKHALNSNGSNCSFHCVDHDKRAIAYAKRLINGNADITWDVANVFYIHPRQKYDLIWTSGLFDYLDDRLAIALIRRMWRWINKNGQIIVGNFHPSNPNRNQMEWCLGWFLNYRNKDDMLRICSKAGIPDDSVSVEYEPLGINIFLVIERD